MDFDFMLCLLQGWVVLFGFGDEIVQDLFESNVMNFFRTNLCRARQDQDY